MGRGDKRTKKGKMKSASYGNSRSHKAPEIKIVPKAVFRITEEPAEKSEEDKEVIKKVAKKASTAPETETTQPKEKPAKVKEEILKEKAS